VSFSFTTNLRGIFLMMVAATVFAFKDGFAKHLTATYSVAELVMAQYGFMLLLASSLLIWRFGWKAAIPNSLPSQLLRGSLGVGTVALFYLAIQHIPLADATALAFISPIVVTLLSPAILKEKVGFRRWAAVIIGFMGILLIVQPGFQDIGVGTWYAIGAGVVFAFFQIATRKLTVSERPLVMVVYTGAVGFFATAAFSPLFFIPPPAEDALILFAMATMGFAGQGLMIYAFLAAPAVVIAPFFYVSIVAATVVGYVVFGDFPNLTAWMGIALIIACGVYIAVREAKAKEPTI